MMLTVKDKKLADAIRLRMLMDAFHQYQKTVSSIEASSDAHLIRINKQ